MNRCGVVRLLIILPVSRMPPQLGPSSDRHHRRLRPSWQQTQMLLKPLGHSVMECPSSWSINLAAHRETWDPG